MSNRSQVAFRRRMIEHVLRQSERPLLARDIADQLGITVEQVSANLAWMRAAGTVAKRRVGTGKVRRFGHRVFSEMVVYWTLAERKRELMLIHRGTWSPVAGHRTIRFFATPRTDDMRAMLDDIQSQINRATGLTAAMMGGRA
jgi:predicted transcriptional regulator